MEILYSILCVACLCIGFFVGYRLPKQAEPKEIKKPSLIKKARENKELEEETKKYMEKYSTILDNINNYDGSGNNQRKVS
jgi:hypothetical protein